MNNLKRLTFNILSVLMVFSLIACSSNGKETEEIQQEIITEETDFYRNILVAEFKGTSNITRNTGDNFEVYEGLSLNDGDDVKVNDHSDLTLNVDSDKHLYADENTHFWIIASGSEGNTKTKIKLEKGSVLCQIKNKLLENEFFEIETASSTMSVRGTVYRVSIIKGVKEDEVYELVEVFNGGVATLINENGESVSLNPGEAALIKEKQDGSDARFVKDDEIDEDFWSSSDLNFNIETDEGEGSPILKISYEKISEGALDKLVEIADEGQQELAVEKEVLEEVKETGHNYKVIQRIEPTCTKDGLVISKCTICNQEMQEVLPKLGHDYKETKTLPTCTEDGNIVNKCSRCGDTTSEKLLATGHNLVTTKTEATCTKEGLILTECTKCNNNTRQTLAKIPHNMEVVSIEPVTKTVEPLVLAENSESAKSTSSLNILSTTKYPDGNEEVVLEVEALEKCTDCDENVTVNDDCYLAYKVTEIGSPSTRTLGPVSFKNLDVSLAVIDKFKSDLSPYNTEILNLLSKAFDHEHRYTEITDLNWLNGSNNSRILNYSIANSTDSSSLNRILTLNNVEASCTCGKAETLTSITISLGEVYDNDDKGSLTYTPLNGYTLSQEVINSLNNYFVHDYIETVKSVTQSTTQTGGNAANNPIVVDITYTCGYHDCIFTRHADKIITQKGASVDNNKEIIWDESDNKVVLQKATVNSLVKQLFRDIFGTQNKEYTYSYELSGDVTKTHIRRNWNGNISVGYLFKVQETKTKGDEVFNNIYPIYAVYNLNNNTGEGTWSIMSPLNIDNNEALMDALQQRANSDIAAYKNQRSLLSD